MDKILDYIKNLPQKLKKLTKSRNLKYGSNSVILVVVVIALAVVLNMVIGLTGLKVDLTPNKLFSLGDTSKGILKDLNKDVTIYGFFDEGTVNSGGQYKEVLDLLNQYTKNPHIKLEIQDPDKNPGFVKKVDPDNIEKPVKNDFIVKCGTKMKLLTSDDLFETTVDQQTYQTVVTGSTAESAFTGAIKFVSADNTPTVYFITGHQELSIDTDYTNVKKYIEMNNFAVSTLNLLTSATVPADATMVVMAAPKADITEKERLMLEDYFSIGGKAIFMFDSLSNGPTFTEFNKLISKYNLVLNNDKIKENDANRHIPTDPYTILLDVPSNAIIPQSFQMVLANSRSIKQLSNQKQYVTITSLAQTGPQSVGEQIDPTAGTNSTGPLDVATAIDYTGGTKEVKIIVMGNASFIADSSEATYGSYYQNSMYFFLYSLNWIQGGLDKNLVAPKEYATSNLTISGSQATATGLGLVVVLPLIIFGIGTYVFIRRRHL